MSPNINPYKEVARKLKTAGFIKISQKGSHVKFVKETATGRRTAIVPMHKEIAIGTLKSILIKGTSIRDINDNRSSYTWFM